MIVNQRTIDLIKKFEGCRLQAYQDSVGVWTIGYGITANAGVGIEPRKGMVIPLSEAEDLLKKALTRFSAQVAVLITAKVSNNEFGACVSLAYNIGTTAFAHSTLLRKLNEGDRDGAAAEFKRWNKAGGEVLKGLTTRRAAERDLFVTPDIVVADMHIAPTPEEKDPPFLVRLFLVILSLFGSRK